MYRISLRPEFALLYGIHPNNKYIPEDKKERWYITKGPMDHIEDWLRTCSRSPLSPVAGLRLYPGRGLKVLSSTEAFETSAL